MLTVLEITLDRPKNWSKDWHDGYIFNVRGELMPIVFDVDGLKKEMMKYSILIKLIPLLFILH